VECSKEERDLFPSSENALSSTSQTKDRENAVICFADEERPGTEPQTLAGNEARPCERPDGKIGFLEPPGDPSEGIQHYAKTSFPEDCATGFSSKARRPGGGPALSRDPRLRHRQDGELLTVSGIRI
jgi:hypothetical protein